jgi:hypothetical protein
MFGDRLHLRVGEGMAEQVESRLREQISAQGGQVARLRAVPPQLEDVFMSLVEAE